jgi:Fe-S-cluster containining protein
MTDERVSVKFELSSHDRTIEAETAIPKGPMRVQDLLPILHAFDDAVIAMATDSIESGGKKISCRAGCGACCRQLVPVAEPEAFYLAEVVAAMPAEHQERVRARFREALEALGEEMTARLRDPSQQKTIEQRRAVGMEYFGRGVPCPFLENESCSIYDYRPMACREYLVTSPAENCKKPGPDTIEMAPLPQKLSEVLYAFGDGKGYEETHWLPLVLAPEWVDEQAGKDQRAFPGPELFQNFVKRTAGK